ncbi:MAG: hypothetical protein K8S00_10075 [Bacteroidales bacterium]|nr:hypothetical protein [Bacteroidales bacterium]
MVKKLIIKLIIFLLLLLAINSIFNSLYKKKMIMNRLFNLQDEQIANYHDTLKYLMIGSSHNTVNPQIIGKSFNYASPNENYIKNYYKIKLLLENLNIHPEYIIINNELPLFSPFASKRFKYDSYWVKHVDYFELARKKNDNDFIYKWFEGNYFSYVGKYKEILMSLYFKSDTSKLINGYRRPVDIKNFADQKKRLEFARQRARLYLSDYEHLDEEMVMYFKKIMSLCKRNGIKVILLSMPVSEEYYIASQEVVNVDQLNNEVDSLVGQYKDMAIQLNYETVFFDHPEYFYNPDHLNPKGADSVSKMIKEDLEYLDRND